MTQIKTAYRVTIPLDERSSEEFGIFLNKDVGLALSKDKGYYQSGGRASQIKIVQIQNDWYIVGKKVDVKTSSNIKDSLREQALGKLTSAEREALNL